MTKMHFEYIVLGVQYKASHSARHSHTMTFETQIQFRPDISTALPDSRMCDVSKSQESFENHEYITLKH